MHSKVEQRYRLKINERFAALRDCIPELQSSDARGGSSDDDIDAPEQRVNKGAVLEKARDYILKLEADKAKITEEKSSLIKQLGLTKHAVRTTMDRPRECEPWQQFAIRVSNCGTHWYEDRRALSPESTKQRYIHRISGHI
jgi:hypothetical protein